MSPTSYQTAPPRNNECALSISHSIKSSFICLKLKTYYSITWCGGGDSNPQGLRHHHLKMACLPIPPPPQQGRYFTVSVLELLASAGLFCAGSTGTVCVATGALTGTSVLAGCFGTVLLTGAGNTAP